MREVADELAVLCVEEDIDALPVEVRVAVLLPDVEGADVRVRELDVD